MRFAVVAAALLATVLQAGSPTEKSRVSFTSVVAMEKSLDSQLAGLSTAEPLEIVGLTQGAYIRGYGAVFICEVNLAPATGISPFHPTRSPDEILRIHQRKVERLPKLRLLIQEALLSTAASLDGVPSNEQIAIAVNLFHWHWENAAGLPSQIIMHGPKNTLVDVKTGRQDRTALASAITVEEF